MENRAELEIYQILTTVNQKSYLAENTRIWPLSME